MDYSEYEMKPIELSDWKCYLFGGDSTGMIYIPQKGKVPNVFVRYMMGVCLGCRWEKSIDD